MLLSDAVLAFENNGVPFINGRLEEDQEPPYALVHECESLRLASDDVTHQDLMEYTVVMRTDHHDLPLEHAIEDALRDAGVALGSKRGWHDHEAGCWCTFMTFNVYER